MKKISIFVGVIVVLVLGIYIIKSQDKGAEINIGDQTLDQKVLVETLNLSRQYSSLRYQTDNILLNTKGIEYKNWNDQMTKLIISWQDFESNTKTLESDATKMSEQKLGLILIPSVHAYSNEEISNVFDRAPAGKKIATLAKFLGVDAKKAYQILKQDQAQVEADAWNKAGDTLQVLESSATAIKDVCKVGVFVGTIALTGGTAAIASGSTLSQAALVVSGADLTLEIADDSAKIALGNNNKISAIASSARVITEPLSAILMISDLPANLTKGIEKLNVISFGAEQLNSTIQEGKVIGIQVPVYTKDVNQKPLKVAVLEKTEVNKWISDQKLPTSPETVAEVENIINKETKIEPVEEDPIITKEETEVKSQNTKGDVGAAGLWEGVLKYTPSQSEPEQQIEYIITLNNDGTIDPAYNGEGLALWKQEGSSLKLFTKEDPKAYYEYSISGDTMTFVKLAGPNSEGKWQEDLAGSNFFGGKFYQISLKKQ